MAQTNSIYFGGIDCKSAAWNPELEDEDEGDPAVLEAKARELAEEGFNRRDLHAQRWLAERDVCELLPLVNAVIDYNMADGEYLPLIAALEALQLAYVDVRWEQYVDAALDFLLKNPVQESSATDD